MKNNRKILLFSIIIAIAAVFTYYKFYYSYETPLWFDEGFTAHYMEAKTLTDFFNRMINYELTPFLYYILTWISVKLIGSTDELTLRLVSIIFSFLSPFALYYLYIELFEDKKGAWISSVFLFISTFYTFITCDARSYSVAIFFLILGVFYYIRMLKNIKYSFLGFCISWILALNTHNYTVIILFILFLHYITYHRKERTADFAVAFSLCVLSFVPNILEFTFSMANVGFMPGFPELADIEEFFYVFFAGYTLEISSLTIWYIIMAASMVLFFFPVFTKERKNPNFMLLIMIVSLYFALIFITAYAFNLRIYQTRFMALTFPFYAAAIGYTISMIKPDYLKAAVLIPVLLINFNSTYNLIHKKELLRNDFRTVAKVIRQSFNKDDAVILVNGYQELLLLYYMPELKNADVTYIKLGDAESFRAERYYKNKKVWLILSHPRMADPDLLVLKRLNSKLEFKGEYDIIRKNPEFSASIILYNVPDNKYNQNNRNRTSN